MYQQGDIIRVPFLYTDGTGSKPRPAIIISGAEINNTQDVLAAQITSKPRNDTFTFKLNDSDLSCPLPNQCQVRCHKIFTVNKDQIISKYCQLSIEKQKELHKKIFALIQICDEQTEEEQFEETEEEIPNNDSTVPQE